MSDLIGHKVVFAVAQIPFETTGDGEVRNIFCTLAPVISLEGEEFEDEDFPNAGLVWWLLRPGVRSLATPGRLIKGTLEEARKYDGGDPSSKFYQVHKESVASVEQSDLVEVLTLRDDDADQLHHLIGPRPIAERNRPVTGTVLVRWRNQVLGPFKANSQGEGIIYEVTLSTARSDQTITVLTDKEFQSVAGGDLQSKTAVVTLEAMDRARADSKLHCSYELLRGAGLQRFSSFDYSRVRLEGNVDIVRRLAKRLLSRRERQNAIAVLTKLEELGSARSGEVLPDDARVLEALRQESESAQASIDDFAGNLLSSGLLDTRLEAAIEGRVQVHLDENAERLKAEIGQRVLDEQAALERLRRQASELQAKLESDERAQNERLQEELSQRRSDTLREIEEERQRLEVELQEQQQVHTLIKDALEHLRLERGQVLGTVLTTLSLLRESPAAATAQAAPAREAREPAKRTPLSTFLTKAHGPGVPDEVSFFERFTTHAERRGFRFRRLDLAAFHLSVKCGDLTIIGGPSGVGKSSLPRLYNEALAGASVADRNRYLEVAVTPAWLDMRDLLGYVNTLDRRFQPSESGLFTHLARAQQEFESRAGDSAIHFVNLDEMNLSQVEHYFSGFLQALERPAGERYVSCFAPETVEEADPLAPWYRLNLPPSLRFVGTVNLDETTKQLSLRLLDRANLIRLSAHSGSAAWLDTEEPVVPEGEAVLLRNYRSWLRDPVLAPTLAEVLDDVRRELAAMGAPLSPRRQRAISTFVASAPREICSPEEALDLQIAQRVVPQLRGTLIEEAAEGLRGLLGVLERRGTTFPESSRALQDLLKQVGDELPFSGD